MPYWKYTQSRISNSSSKPKLEKGVATPLLPSVALFRPRREETLWSQWVPGRWADSRFSLVLDVENLHWSVCLVGYRGPYLVPCPRGWPPHQTPPLSPPDLCRHRGALQDAGSLRCTTPLYVPRLFCHLLRKLLALRANGPAKTCKSSPNMVAYNFQGAAVSDIKSKKIRNLPWPQQTIPRTHEKHPVLSRLQGHGKAKTGGGASCIPRPSLSHPDSSDIVFPLILFW